MIEPPDKRAVAFIDGQNLFHSAKNCFACEYPNYDVQALAQSVSRSRGWNLIQIRFYTGIHEQGRGNDNDFWHGFWSAKLREIGRQGVSVFPRPLRYNRTEITLPDGRKKTKYVGNEKGIDILIALHAIHLALNKEYDVALIFSQDQDFCELAAELHKVALRQDRWLKIASAYPWSEQRYRGIENTDWIPIHREQYERCIDPCTYGYRPKK